MRAGERLIASDGYEVCLFFMPYLNISQKEGIGTHEDTWNIDYLGWDANGRVYNAPIYAPVSCHCVFAENSYGSANARVFQSNNLVHLADGTLNYCCFEIAHDPSPIASVGSSYTQGDVIGKTGAYGGGATGDHVHTAMARGTWAGFDNTGSHQQLNNAMHQYDGFYINDTVIIDGAGYNWKTWSDPSPTPTGSSKFPWYIYFRKRRNLWK